MSLPWFQVERSSRTRASYVAALLGISRHEAQGILWDLWEFALDWNKEGPPACELPNRVAASLLAEACSWPIERASDLVDAFRQAGFVAVTRTTTRVTGLDRYEAAWRRYHNLNADGSRRIRQDRAAAAQSPRGNRPLDGEEDKTIDPSPSPPAAPVENPPEEVGGRVTVDSPSSRPPEQPSRPASPRAERHERSPGEAEPAPLVAQEPPGKATGANGPHAPPPPEKPPQKANLRVVAGLSERELFAEALNNQRKDAKLDPEPTHRYGPELDEAIRLYGPEGVLRAHRNYLASKTVLLGGRVVPLDGRLPDGRKPSWPWDCLKKNVDKYLDGPADAEAIERLERPGQRSERRPPVRARPPAEPCHACGEPGECRDSKERWCCYPCLAERIRDSGQEAEVLATTAWGGK